MRYPIFGIGQQGKSSNVTAQRRVNLYVDVQPQEDKTQISLHPTPGLTLFTDLGDAGPVRGLYSVGDTMYAVWGDSFYSIDAAGTATDRGTLNTANGRVDMVDNHAGVIGIQDGTNGYFYTIASATFAVVTDAQHIDTAESLAYHDGYFIYPRPGTGQFFISTADATDVADMMSATDFATAEKSPDDLVRVFTANTEILLCGEKSLEFFSNTGAADFPYARVTGGVIELGLAAINAISRFGQSSTMLLANNAVQGEVQVIRIDGFQYTTVSNPEIDTIFNTYTTANATAFSYIKEGHTFFQLSFPADKKSWLYDGTTNLWSELTYAATGARHRAELGTDYQNKMYVGDYQNGKIYKLTSGNYTDNSVPIIREVVGRHIFDEGYVQISRLWADMEQGVGLNAGQGVDPQLILQVSKDGGHSWGVEKPSSIGKIGEYTKRCIWRRLGRGYDWLFRLRTSDPVKTVFIGAYVDTAG